MTNAKINNVAKIDIAKINDNVEKSNVEKSIEKMICFAHVARELNVHEDLIKRSRAHARKNNATNEYDVIRTKTFARDSNAHKIAIKIVNAFIASMKTKIAQ